MSSNQNFSRQTPAPPKRPESASSATSSATAPPPPHTMNLPRQNQMPQKRPESAIPESASARQMQTPAPPRRQEDEKKSEDKLKIYPSVKTLQSAFLISIKDYKPIQVSFWEDSVNSEVSLLRDLESKEQIIYKNDEEYTSPIVNITTCQQDIICETENSVYVLYAKNIKIVEK